jgi:hypothetical protein
MVSRLAAVAALSLVVLAPACGASEPGASAAPTLAPRDTLALVEIQSDLETEQWQAARALLDRFPDGDELFAKLTQELHEEGLDLEEDVAPALGERVVLVVVARAGAEPDLVALTQPDDRKKLDALVAEDEDLETRDIAGWTAIGSAAALSRYERALDAGTLEGDDSYEAAAAKFPEDALATAFVSGAAAKTAAKDDIFGSGEFDWVSAALIAEERGVRLEGTIKGQEGAEMEPVDDALLDEVPGDAFAVLAFGSGIDLERQLQAPGVSELQGMLGLNLKRIASLVDDGGVLWVRPGLPIPEFTLLLPGASVADVDELVGPLAALAGAKVTEGTLDGARSKRIQIGPVTLSYAEINGRLVVTTASSLRESGDTLEDAEAFREATEVAGMPDETDAFLYLNLRQLVPLIEGLIGFSGDEVPDEVSRNLDPLASAVAFGQGEGDESSFTVFLEIR